MFNRATFKTYFFAHVNLRLEVSLGSHLFIILVCGLFTDTLSDDPEKGPRCVTQLKGSTSWNRTPVLGTLGLDRMLSGMLLCPTPSCHDLSRGCDGAHSLIVLLLLY